ncbi:hypothetical protein A0H81_14546 [Grifola frondosa]|uniref:Uncharacterized protein n=1 Tax=Grifola frondosa TaxID=5627 RepID=A0A1C7LKX3_GRIFR|nr:hypothetical protein A0H81_14546 [Grifola frondosa]
MVSQNITPGSPDELNFVRSISIAEVTLQLDNGWFHPTFSSSNVIRRLHGHRRQAACLACLSFRGAIVVNSFAITLNGIDKRTIVFDGLLHSSHVHSF